MIHLTRFFVPLFLSLFFAASIGGTVLAAADGAGQETTYIKIDEAVLGKDTPTKNLFNVFGGFGQVLNPGTIVARVIMSLLGFVGVILLGIVTYSGFLWMTAAGEEEKIKKARTMLTQSLVGLILIMMTWSITYFTVGKLIQCTTISTGC